MPLNTAVKNSFYFLFFYYFFRVCMVSLNFKFKKIRMKIIKVTIFLGIFITTQTILAQNICEKVNESVVDLKALTIDGGFGQAINGKSFQQHIMLTHLGFQYLAYYNNERHVCLARRKLPKGKWEIVRFTDYDFKSNDAHNTISLGICPNDGTIHLAFDHHGHDLNYRVSKKDVANKPTQVNWESSAFGPVVSELEKGKSIKITYPRFWQTPEGNIQFCYRRGGSGNGDRMLVDYDPVLGSWKNTRQIDSGDGTFTDKMGKSDSRCSYPNGYNYGPEGKLHATWVWRESSQGANHDLVYVYSDDKGNTWKNNEGVSLVEIPHVNSPGVIVHPISRDLGLMNTHGQTVDSKGRVHVVMWHCSEETIRKAGSEPGEFRWGPPEARRYHHYWRDINGKWNHFEMDWRAGNRPKIFTDKNDNLILIYGGQPVKKMNEENVERKKSDLVIAVATAEKKWKDWQVVYTLNGPFVNEMLGDFYRWKSEGVLSVLIQDFPDKIHEPTSLKVVDFVFQF